VCSWEFEGLRETWWRVDNDERLVRIYAALRVEDCISTTSDLALIGCD
jgi:hypothetical protein